MKRNVVILMILATVFLSNGCVTKYGEFAVIGTNKFDLNMQEFEKVGENMTGESTGYMVVIFPVKYPTIKEAIQDALRKVNGDVMTDAAIYHKMWMIPPFYDQMTYEIKGTVWKLKNKK